MIILNLYMISKIVMTLPFISNPSKSNEKLFNTWTNNKINWKRIIITCNYWTEKIKRPNLTKQYRKSSCILSLLNILKFIKFLNTYKNYLNTNNTEVCKAIGQFVIVPRKYFIDVSSTWKKNVESTFFFSYVEIKMIFPGTALQNN